jgi:nicotinate-nucleotide adenylyltransferase
MARGRVGVTGSPPTAGGWGVLGGTFDPIHCAHLAIAEQTREALGLSGVLFVPAGKPPHKLGQRITPAQHRLAMVELAIEGNPAFRVSRIELDRPGPSYTVDTVARLLADPPQPWDQRAGLLLILSVEALLGLGSWHEPERLLRLCRLAVVPRRGYPVEARAWVAEHFPGLEERVVELQGPDLGHSASSIRERVAAGLTIRYLVPPAVEAYVRVHGLYRTPASELAASETGSPATGEPGSAPGGA